MVSEYLIYVKPMADESTDHRGLGGYAWVAKLPSRTVLYQSTSAIDLFTVRIPLGHHESGKSGDEGVLGEGEAVMKQKAADCYPEFTFDFILHQRKASVNRQSQKASQSFFGELILLLFWMEEFGFAERLLAVDGEQPEVTWPDSKQWEQLRDATHTKLHELVG